MDRYLTTWFYAEDENDESNYPQIGCKPSSSAFQKVYWRCVYCFFRSAVITNGTAVRYLFFTNVQELPADVDGVDIGRFFRDSGIEVIRTELTKKTPTDWFASWRNQFYLFDILEKLKTIPGCHIVLDSDCIISKPLDPLYCEIGNCGNVAYAIGGSNPHPINGITQDQMRAIYQDMFGEGPCEDLHYHGGEIVAIRSDLIPDLLDTVGILWEKNFQRYRENRFKLNEEAHFLSLAYYRLHMDNDRASRCIKRMWTGKRCDTIKKADRELLIFHLPGEKMYGFKRLFRWLGTHQTVTGQAMRRKVNSVFLLSAPAIIRKANKILQAVTMRTI